MVMTDPIADMLTRIRNANTVRHDQVDIQASRLKTEIARIFKEQGYISDFKLVDNDDKKPVLRLFMRYSSDSKDRIITGIRRISKPGLRVYASKDEIPQVLGGLGVAILSTSKGVLSDKEARKEGVGGEVVCYVW